MQHTSEIWRPIKGHEGYEVSNLGRVSVFKKGERFIRAPNSATHYLSISFRKRLGDKSQKSNNIHCLVAEAFIGPRPLGQVVRHLDGNRYNNEATNLAYGTPAENIYDDLKNGARKGSKNGRAIFDERHVVLIRRLLKEGVGTSELARLMNVSIGTIHAIKMGKNWKDLE